MFYVTLVIIKFCIIRFSLFKTKHLFTNGWFMKKIIKIAYTLLLGLIVTSNSIFAAAAYPTELDCFTGPSEDQWNAVPFGVESIMMATNLSEFSIADVVALQIIKDPTRAGLRGKFLSVRDNQLIARDLGPGSEKTRFIILRNNATGELGFNSIVFRKSIMAADPRAKAPHTPYKVSVQGEHFFRGGTWESWIAHNHADGIALLNENSGGYLVVSTGGSWTSDIAGNPNIDINNATIFQVYKKAYKSFDPTPLADEATPGVKTKKTPPGPTLKATPTRFTPNPIGDLKKIARPSPVRPLSLHTIGSGSACCEYLIDIVKDFVYQEIGVSTDPSSRLGEIKKINTSIADYEEMLNHLSAVSAEIAAARRRPKGNIPAMVIKTEANARIAVVGDLHGNIEALLAILADLDINQHFFNPTAQDQLKLSPNCYMIFLGDYVDRGPNGVLAVFIASLLFAQNQENVILLRGNHETKQMYEIYGLREEFIARGFFDGQDNAFDNFFNALPLTIMLAIAKSDGVNNGYNLMQFCHGGLGKMFAQPQPDYSPAGTPTAKLNAAIGAHALGITPPKEAFFTWDGINEELSIDHNIFELFEPSLYENFNPLIHVPLKNYITLSGNQNSRAGGFLWNDFNSSDFVRRDDAKKTAAKGRTSISPEEVKLYFDIAQSKLRPQDTFCAVIRAHAHTCYPWALMGDNDLFGDDPWINPGDNITLSSRSADGFPNVLSVISSAKTTAYGENFAEEICARIAIPGKSAAYVIIESNAGQEPIAFLRHLQ